MSNENEEKDLAIRACMEGLGEFIKEVQEPLELTDDELFDILCTYAAGMISDSEETQRIFLKICHDFAKMEKVKERFTDYNIKGRDGGLLN